MGEPGRIQVWWSRLSRAWRFNVTLYLLACLSLFALIVQVLTEEAPRRVEVAGNGSRPSTTRATRTAGPPTTTAAPTPQTTVALTPEAVPTTGPQAPGPPAEGFDPSSATTLPCRNSTNPECGPFFYDPLPRNAPMSVEAQIASFSAVAGGQRVTFTVTVNDPDHAVNGCGTADFGDGTSESRPCAPDPPCPPRFGPWDPPPTPGGGTGEFSFGHDYLVPGPRSFTARFTFRTEQDGCRDPYASTNAGTVSFTVNPPPEGT